MADRAGGAGSAPGRGVAAIDCGTNSTRLLVRRDGRTVERLMHITRLGQGVDATGRLDPAAIERTIAVLGDYREIMDRHGVDAVRMAATSATRDAANRVEFVEAATTAIGVAPEVLAGEVEAALSFDGATAELDPAGGPYLVADIGGGSTELAVGSTRCEGARSLDIGCVRVTERFFDHDPPEAEELSAALSVIETWLEDAAAVLPALRDARRFVGLAGTVTTVAAVELGLSEYDRDRIHHFTLTRAAAEDVFRTLATEPLADRVHNPGLEEARADVIVGGCCVLVGIMRHFDLDECLVSEADILDGLARSIDHYGAGRVD